MADTVSLNRAEPWGAKPRRALSGRNIMLYGTLLVAAGWIRLFPALAV